MRFIVYTFILLLILLFAPPFLVSVSASTCPKNDLEWGDLVTPGFVIIFSQEDAGLATGLLERLGTDLHDDYARFASIFGQPLNHPITIRIYPDERFYQCLNPLAPELAPDGYHAHIGAREIALVGDRIDDSRAGWQVELLNALRYELAALFVDRMTDGKAPPGLKAGIGAYAQDPHESRVERWVSTSAGLGPAASWRTLWEQQSIAHDQELHLAALSIVAYLVDVHGWPKFIQFLQQLSTVEGYRQALASVYAADPADLQDHWRSYYPLFLQGRWRANVIYGFDLSVFERLVAAGAYADAAEGLKETIVFLEDLGENEQLARARALLQVAQVGQEAGALARQSRQALQQKDYALSAYLARQARQKYQEIGDGRRLAELDANREWAEEVLALRAEVEAFQNQQNPGREGASIERLVQIGQRLASLGDEQGVAQANQILAESETRRQNRATTLSAVGLIVCLGLLLMRLRSSRQPPPAEARLL
jgi:type II secretory pathway component PulJ